MFKAGCIEHLDFVNLDDIEFNVKPFEELDVRTAQLKSKASLRNITLEDESPIDETLYKIMDDHTLFNIITRSDSDNIKETSAAIVVMMKRYSGNFVVQNETLQAHLEKVYRAACQTRQWSLVRYCASHLKKTITSLAPSITYLLARGKQVIIGMKSCLQITINTPQTPGELAAALFNSCRSDSEPQAAVFQQELVN